MQAETQGCCKHITIDYTELASIGGVAMGYEKKYDNMRKAKDKIRIESPCIAYPSEVPKLRKIIIVINFDFLLSINVFKLFRSRHIDQYIVEQNGKKWTGKHGLSKILAEIRKLMPRVLSSRAL